MIFLGPKANQKTWSWSLELRETATRLNGAPKGGRRAPHPRGPLVAPLTYFFRLYILLYSRSIRESHETTFPPPQHFVPVRSHLGAFFWWSVRGGFDHEGLLHQHHSLSNDVWVVYHRPSGPWLLARWLLLSLSLSLILNTKFSSMFLEIYLM